MIRSKEGILVEASDIKSSQKIDKEPEEGDTRGPVDVRTLHGVNPYITK